MPGIERFWAIIIIATLVAAAVRYAPFVPEKYRIWLSVAIVLAFICWMPFTVGSFRTSQLTTVAAWSVVALGLNLLTGYNGQISLGHGAFVTIGAYTAAILTDNQEQLGFIDSTAWPFWTAMIMAGIVAAGTGVLVGIPSLRLTGPYLAVATLALVIAMPSVLARYPDFTGGNQGLRVPQPPVPGFLDGVLDRSQWFFFLAMLTAFLLALLAWYIVSSRWGRAFIAIRDSEVAATAIGISAGQYKVLAFSISAFYAGIAGALFVFASTGYITPQSIGILLSVNYFTAIIIGGMGSILGSIIGGFVVVLLPDVATHLGAAFFGEQRGSRLWPTIYGSILIVVIIAMPYGVAGFVHRLARLRAADASAWLRGIPAAAHSRLGEMKEEIAWSWEARPGRDRREP